MLRTQTSTAPLPAPVPPPAPPMADKRGASQDPIAVSESLRRIRQSGPLIIEAVKDKQDRFNEIISQAVESMNEPKEGPRAAGMAPPPPTAPPPVSERPRGAAPKSKSSSGAGALGVSAGQAVAKLAAGTMASVAAATQAVARKATGSLSAGASSSSNASGSTGSLTGTTPVGLRAGTGSLSAGASTIPPNGPSTVLVQASGLKPQSFGSKFRAGIIILAILIATGIYFIFRDNLLLSRRPAEAERNLVGPEEQSTQYVQMAEQERQQKNLDGARNHVQQALELMPHSPSARLMLGRIQLDAGQPDDALKTFQGLVRSAPENLEARLQIAEIYRARNNWNAAYQEYQRIIAMDSNSGQAQVALAEIEKHQAEQPEPPEPIVTVKEPRRPNKPQKAPVLPVASSNAAQLAILPNRGTPAPNVKPPTTLAVPRTEEKPDPRGLADTHKKLGVRYLNVREYRAAISEFLTALRLTPEDKDLYYFLGSSYHGLNQPVEAFEYYRRVDRGPYIGPAQSGTRLTEKAAREEMRRRSDLKNEAGGASPSEKTTKSGQSGQDD